MSDTSNPNGSNAHSESQPGGTANSNPQSGRCVFESLHSALNEGAQHAKAAAEKAIPKVKAALSDATYWLGYGASFATVFSYTVVKELAPEVLKAGCRDGAQAGQKNAEEVASKFKAWSAGTGATSSSDSTGPAGQPGVA